jgi:hypothetical protein
VLPRVVYCSSSPDVATLPFTQRNAGYELARRPQQRSCLSTLNQQLDRHEPIPTPEATGARRRIRK